MILYSVYLWYALDLELKSVFHCQTGPWSGVERLRWTIMMSSGERAHCRLVQATVVGLALRTQTNLTSKVSLS